MQTWQKHLGYCFFVILSLILLPKGLNGQDISVSIKTLQAKVNKAQQYLSSAQPDSARYILKGPLQQLQGTVILKTDLGLEAQYIFAQSLEIDQQDSLALKTLIALKEKSLQLENWSVYIRSTLVIALIHEKLDRAQQSKVNLEDAHRILKQFPIDSVYTSFSIRYASWHRIYGNRDSAQYYAERALFYARKETQISEEAQAHLLLGLLTKEEDYLKAIGHYQEAKRLCAIIDDYLGQTYYNANIAHLYILHNQPEKALAYNDSSLIGVRNAVGVGYDENWIGHRPYRFRGQIFQELGQLDSAYFYLEKGAEMELANLHASQRKEVAQIDAKFVDEQKKIQIAQQKQAIQQGHFIRYLLLGLILMILTITCIQINNARKLKAVNTTIHNQAQQLQALDQMKSQFFANVSHELRTPLTLMLGPIQRLQENNHSRAKRQKLLQQARQSGRQLEALIQEILDLQKLSVGTLTVYLQETQLADYFRSHLAQFESIAVNKSINYTYDILIPDQYAAAIDREKCRQIMYNLLSNAFKHTAKGGEVELRLSSEANQLQLMIKDTGSGIPVEDLPHIFDRYFQRTQPGSATTGGTGIGLAICKGYTELMGGNIEVESQVGVGTQFRVHLPIKILGMITNEAESMVLLSGQAVEATSTVIHAGPVNGNPILEDKPKLLLVDDNPAILSYLRDTLMETYKVITAQNGAEALDILSQQPGIQLILSDLMMPIMDGQQLLKQLKTQDTTRHLPVIMLTARADMGSKLKALRMGVDDYLLKPFNDLELKTRIENLLQNQNNRSTTTLEVIAPLIESFSAEDQAWLISLETYIEKNLGQNNLSVPLLASAFSMSKSTLLRKLKSLTGLTPKQYLQEARLQAARHQLENKHSSAITEVAKQVGYKDVRSFSRLFKKRFGKLPSEY